MTSSNENRHLFLPLVILGLFLFLGLSIVGHFVGKGAARLQSDTRTVKGLVAAFCEKSYSSALLVG